MSVKHINLDHEDDQIKRFVRSLPVDPDGSLLELEGEAVFRVLPVEEPQVDADQLKQAILHRRDASRAENAEWEDADDRMWNSHGGIRT